MTKSPDDKSVEALERALGRPDNENFNRIMAGLAEAEQMAKEFVSNKPTHTPTHVLTTFELGRILYTARIIEAWGSAGRDKLLTTQHGYPRHEGDPRSASVDLAIAQAKALLKLCDVVMR